MRYSPTSVLSVAAFAILAVVTGCSTDNGEADEEQAPPAAAQQKSNVPSDSNKSKDLPPAFEPTFDPTAGNNGPTDPTKDPTPTGGDQNQCVDTDDARGSENVAKKLPDTDDCDNDYKTVNGTVKGAVDVDFYTLGASDKFGCSVDADFQADTAGTELCVFMRCKNSTKDAVTGCEAGSETTSEIGMKGCCAAAPGRALPKWDCSGFTDNDSADIFMRVRQINGDKCLPYKVKYRF